MNALGKTLIMEISNLKIETRKAGDVTPSSLPAGHARNESDVVEPEAKHLREELDIERDARLRLAAEYQNYRRRTEDEKSRAADNGKRELLMGMLSIVDDLELALGRANERPETITEGVQMIRRRFLDLLESNGVTAFESEGERFDPERHDAFDMVDAGEGESGTVAKEMRRGYFWNGILMRPAMVAVRR